MTDDARSSQPPSPKCPPSDSLRRFLDEQLGADDSQIIAAHLETCSTCQTRCEQLTHTNHAPPRGDVVRRSDRSLAGLIRKLLDAKPPDAARLVTPASATTISVIEFPGVPDERAPLGRLGQYAILAAVSEGNQGILYRALDDTLNRVVALKVVHHRLSQSAHAVERFRREARLIAAVQSEYVVRVFQTGQHPDFPPFLVMEFVDGESLRQRMDRSAVPFQEAAVIVRDTAKGLLAAHKAGLVHRDVKPSNILLDQRAGHARLTDFGLAIEEEETVRMTQEGVILGTPAYMSPEQVTHLQDVDSRSDVYSLGVVLYELLTGDVPFRGTVRTTLVQLVHEEPRPPRRYNDAIPRDLETICLKAMAREPAKRYQSAAELIDELDRWLNGQPIHSRPTSGLERAWRWCRRNPIVSSMTLTIAALLLILLAVTTTFAIRMAEARRVAENQAAAAERQSSASLNTLSRLIFELQKQFDDDFIDLNDLQQQTLRIAIDGLREVSATPGTSAESDLATTEALRRLGETLLRMKQESEALSCAEQAESILRTRLKSAPDNPEALKSMVETLWLRSEALIHATGVNSDPASATEKPSTSDLQSTTALSDAIEFARQMYRVAPSDEATSIFAIALLKRGGTTATTDQSAIAKRDLAEALSLFESLLDNSDELGVDARTSWLEAADMRYQALNATGGDGAAKEAESQLETSQRRCDQLIMDHPEEVVLRVMRLEIQDRLITQRELSAQQHNAASPESSATGAIADFEAQVTDLARFVSPDLGQFLDVGDALSEVVTHRLADSSFPAARRFANALLSICEQRLQVARDDPDALLYNAQSWSNLAVAEQQLESQPEAVMRCFTNSLASHHALQQTDYVSDSDRVEYFDTLVATLEFARQTNIPVSAELQSKAETAFKEIRTGRLNVSTERLENLQQRINELTPE